MENPDAKLWLSMRSIDLNSCVVHRLALPGHSFLGTTGGIQWAERPGRAGGGTGCQG